MRAVALAATLAAVVGLGAGSREQSPWEMHRPSDAWVTGTFEHPMLNESSGIAIEARRDVAYIPWFWRPMMTLITSLPEFVFKRLRL